MPVKVMRSQREIEKALNSAKKTYNALRREVSTPTEITDAQFRVLGDVVIVLEWVLGKPTGWLVSRCEDGSCALKTRLTTEADLRLALAG